MLFVEIWRLEECESVELPDTWFNHLWIARVYDVSTQKVLVKFLCRSILKKASSMNLCGDKCILHIFRISFSV